MLVIPHSLTRWKGAPRPIFVVHSGTSLWSEQQKEAWPWSNLLSSGVGNKTGCEWPGKEGVAFLVWLTNCVSECPVWPTNGVPLVSEHLTWGNCKWTSWMNNKNGVNLRQPIPSSEWTSDQQKGAWDPYEMNNQGGFRLAATLTNEWVNEHQKE